MFRSPLILLLCVAACTAHADVAALRFQTLTIEDGLAQNSVTAITQDSNGYLWFGSQDGLARYDGRRFTIFKNDPNDTRSIAGNYINALLPGVDGDTWIGTRFAGLAHFDAASGHFEHIGIRYAGGASDTRFVVHALAFHEGQLWAATDRGLATLDGQQRELHLVALPGADAFPETRGLHADANGLWIGTLGRIYRLEENTFRVIPLPQSSLVVNALLTTADDALIVATNRGAWRAPLDAEKFTRITALPPAIFTTLANDRDGGLWIGGRGGGVYYAAKHGEDRWENFTYRADDPYGLGQNIVFDIHADNEGIVWIGTYGGGLSRTVLQQRRFGLQQRRADGDGGLSSNIVFPLHEDSNGIVWIGTYNDGLNRWDRNSDEWSYFRHQPDQPGSLSNNEVRALLVDERGTLWVGTHGGLDRLDPGDKEFIHYRHDANDPQSVAHDGITTLFIDSANRFWVGTWGGGLDLFDRERGTFTHFAPDRSREDAISSGLVSDIVETRDGSLWVATERGGVNRLDARTGSFTHYRHDAHNSHSLVDDSVNTLWADGAGYLWIGTANGLDRLDIKTGEIRHFRERDGLANNLVLGILGDDHGNLWISTNRGLSQFNIATERFHTWHLSDGLQSDEYNSFAYFRNARGELYFGGIGGFNVFDPADITNNTFPPPVTISGLALFNQAVLPDAQDANAILTQPVERTRAIELEYHQNLFSIEFAALSFLDPVRNRFAYRLLGFSPEWIETAADKPLATYTNLDPGEYRFEVRAANPDGAWSAEAASLAITVLPPWWRTGPAWLAYAFLLAFVGWFILQYQRKRIEVRYLAREKATAEEATRLKSSFLALMSHEIRTPMNGVLGMVQLLARTRLSRRQRGYVEALEKSGESLLTILDDVLDFSRIEANVISFEKIPFDPREAIESVLLLLGPRARQKGLALSFQGEGLPSAIAGDPTRFRQVLMNLVSNAIKFTQAGGVKIRAAATPVEENRVQLTITVEDTGIGISAMQQANLFEAFVQAEAATQRTHGGTGLGLSICKRLVELQGGDIGVQSEPGAGSVFWFDLQFDIAAAPPRVDAAPARRGRMLRVLLVEDQHINQEVARGLLEHEGHAVSVAPDGITALRLASEREFDVVLMDIHMPGMDGRETTRRIRGLDDPVKAALPILGLTASISADEVAACLDAGMNKVLRKPLPVARLMQALAQLDDEVDAATAAEDETQLVDARMLAQHRNMLGEARFTEIVATFASTGANLVDAIESAALAADDAAIRRDAHRLAGAAASMGCYKLAAVATRVEQGHAEPDNLRSVFRQTEHALRAAERQETA